MPPVTILTIEIRKLLLSEAPAEVCCELRHWWIHQPRVYGRLLGKMTPAHPAMATSYNYYLVALSVVISTLASYAALDLAGRVTAAQGRLRLAWLAGGACAMGIGIWSMHYIGMLAFRLPVAVFYDWPTVAASLLCAIFASGVALFVVSRPRMGLLQPGLGSVVMGVGIAAMHYIGMAAMRLRAECSYSPLLVTVSVLLAIVISLVALWLSFTLRDVHGPGWKKKASAVLMGVAIPVMRWRWSSGAQIPLSVSRWPRPRNLTPPGRGPRDGCARPSSWAGSANFPTDSPEVLRPRG